MAESITQTTDRVLIQLDQQISAVMSNIVNTISNSRGAGASDEAIIQSLTDSIAVRGPEFAPLISGLKKDANQMQQRFFIDGYREGANIEDQKLYMWRAIGSGSCPTCVDFHGDVMSYIEWEREGVPGAGLTICGHQCRCVLTSVRQVGNTIKSGPYEGSSIEDLTSTAKEGIKGQLKLLRDEEKRRGRPFARSTFLQKLGDFKKVRVDPKPDRIPKSVLEFHTTHIQEFRLTGKVKAYTRFGEEKEAVLLEEIKRVSGELVLREIRASI